jgi:hypothetical protein
MTSLVISGIVFACVFSGTLLGILLRAILPEQHLSSDSKDVVKLGMGLIGTMTALVLGLMIASAKGSFDTQRAGIAQLAGDVIMIDRNLAHFGPEAKEVREKLRASLADMIARTWPENGSSPPSSQGGTEGKYEFLMEKIQELPAKTDAQRTFQAQAFSTVIDAAKLRWSLFSQKGSSIPLPFLVVIVAWLTLLFASFSLFAPPNPTVVITLLICALAVSAAIFLILELDRPFSGMIQVSSAPLHAALDVLGK